MDNPKGLREGLSVMSDLERRELNLKLIESYKFELKTCFIDKLDANYIFLKEHLFYCYSVAEVIDGSMFEKLLCEVREIYYERKSLEALLGSLKKEDAELSVSVEEAKEIVKAEVIAVMAESVENEFQRVVEMDVPLCKKDGADLTFYYGYFTAAHDFGIISEDRKDEMNDELTTLFFQKDGEWIGNPPVTV